MAARLLDKCQGRLSDLTTALTSLANEIETRGATLLIRPVQSAST